MVAIFGALSGWFMGQFGRKPVGWGARACRRVFSRSPQPGSPCSISPPRRRRMQRSRCCSACWSAVFVRAADVDAAALGVSRADRRSGRLRARGLLHTGPFAGYFFGKLVEVLGWGPAAIFTVVLPAVIAASLMGFFDMRSMRSA
jgi:hypothetical protein